MKNETVVVTASVDSRVKTAAEGVFKRFGLSTDEAIGIFFETVVAGREARSILDPGDVREPVTMVTTWGNYDC